MYYQSQFVAQSAQQHRQSNDTYSPLMDSCNKKQANRQKSIDNYINQQQKERDFHHDVGNREKVQDENNKQQNRQCLHESASSASTNYTQLPSFANFQYSKQPSYRLPSTSIQMPNHPNYLCNNPKTQPSQSDHIYPLNPNKISFNMNQSLLKQSLEPIEETQYICKYNNEQTQRLNHLNEQLQQINVIINKINKNNNENVINKLAEDNNLNIQRKDIYQDRQLNMSLLQIIQYNKICQTEISAVLKLINKFSTFINSHGLISPTNTKQKDREHYTNIQKINQQLTVANNNNITDPMILIYEIPIQMTIIPEKQYDSISVNTNNNELMSSTSQLKQLTNQQLTASDNAYCVINNFYQIPVELCIQPQNKDDKQNKQYCLKASKEIQSQYESYQMSSKEKIHNDEEMISQGELIIKVTESNKQINVDQSMMNNTAHFNNVTNSLKTHNSIHELNVDSMVHENTNRQNFIQSLTMILKDNTNNDNKNANNSSKELNINSTNALPSSKFLSPQKISTDTQTLLFDIPQLQSNTYQNLSIQPLVLQYTYIHTQIIKNPNIEYQMVKRSKYRNRIQLGLQNKDHVIEQDKQKQQPSNNKDQECLITATNQMLMLLENHEPECKVSDNSNNNSDIDNNNNNDDHQSIEPNRTDNQITYNYKINIKNNVKQQNGNVNEKLKDYNMIMQFNNVLNNSNHAVEENQTTTNIQQPITINKQPQSLLHEPSSQQPINSKNHKKSSSNFNNSQSTPIQQYSPHSPSLQDHSHSYQFPYPCIQHDNSNQPSFNINGISVIKNKQQYSQSQQQSQIIPKYLQIQMNNTRDQNIKSDSDGNQHVLLKINSPTSIEKVSKNRSLGNPCQYGYQQQNLYPQNVIQQRYNSEQSKSKRTSTKNINVNGNTGAEQQDQDFVVQPVIDVKGRRRYCNNNKFGGSGINRYSNYNNLGSNNLNNLLYRPDDEHRSKVGAENQYPFLQQSLTIQTNQIIEEKDKKKAKQRLSQHPYLNFYETSYLDQLDNLKGQSCEGKSNSNNYNNGGGGVSDANDDEMVIFSSGNTKNQKKQGSSKNQNTNNNCNSNENKQISINNTQNNNEKIKDSQENGDGGKKGISISSGSFFQPSILINMSNLQAILLKDQKQQPSNTKSNKQQQKIKSQPNIIKSSPNFTLSSNSRGVSSNILKNANNQVYIIDGETSSEGSRANKQMRISQIKNSSLSGMLVNDDLSCQHKFVVLNELMNFKTDYKDSTTNHNMKRGNNQQQVSQLPQKSSHKNLRSSLSSNPKQSIIPAQQYYQLYQKTTSLQQQNNGLQQKISQYQQKLQLIKTQQISSHMNQIYKQNSYKNKLGEIMEQITGYDKKLQLLEIELEGKRNQYHELKKRNGQLEKICEENQISIKCKEEELEKIGEELKLLEESYTKNVQNLTTMNTQKQEAIEYYKAQCSLLKEEHEQLIQTLKNDINLKYKQIEKYGKEIQEKNQLIQQLTNDYNKIMVSLQTACQEKDEYIRIIKMGRQHSPTKETKDSQQKNKEYLTENNDDNIHRVYEGEFEKYKQLYVKQLEGKNSKILKLQIENQQLDKQLKNIENLLMERTEQQKINQQEIEKLTMEKRMFEKNQLEKKKEKYKIDISSEVQAELDYLRMELVKVSLQLQQKQQIVKRFLEQSQYSKQQQQMNKARIKQTQLQNYRTPPKKILQKKQNAQLDQLKSKKNKRKNTSPSNEKLIIQQMPKLNLENIRMQEYEQSPNCDRSKSNSLKMYYQEAREDFIIPCTKVTNPAGKQIRSNGKQRVEAPMNQLSSSKELQYQLIVKQYQQYISQLQKIILNYEHLLLTNQKQIRDLQSQVKQYLQAAIDKQHENQSLYLDVQTYQNQLNQILMDKINIELQNKRMRRMVLANERKISAIGTRLIYAAKNKLKGKDEVGGMEYEGGERVGKNTLNSQNSTIKIRELRIQ